MLSDEELKEIETKQAQRRACLSNTPKCPPLDYDPQYSCIKHTLIDDLADESEDLLAEVKRLRSLMRRQTFTSESGWQSVAEAVPPPEREGKSISKDLLLCTEGDVICGYFSTVSGYYDDHGQRLSAVSHWMLRPDPPPPIKRESRDENHADHDNGNS